MARLNTDGQEAYAWAKSIASWFRENRRAAVFAVVPLSASVVNILFFLSVHETPVVQHLVLQAWCVRLYCVLHGDLWLSIAISQGVSVKLSFLGALLPLSISLCSLWRGLRETKMSLLAPVLVVTVVGACVTSFTFIPVTFGSQIGGGPGVGFCIVLFLQLAIVKQAEGLNSLGISHLSYFSCFFALFIGDVVSSWTLFGFASVIGGLRFADGLWVFPFIMFLMVYLGGESAIEWLDALAARSRRITVPGTESQEQTASLLWPTGALDGCSYRKQANPV